VPCMSSAVPAQTQTSKRPSCGCLNSPLTPCRSRIGPVEADPNSPTASRGHARGLRATGRLSGSEHQLGALPPPEPPRSPATSRRRSRNRIDRRLDTRPSCSPTFPVAPLEKNVVPATVVTMTVMTPSQVARRSNAAAARRCALCEILTLRSVCCARTSGAMLASAEVDDRGNVTLWRRYRPGNHGAPA
jgi:hypothetical protein